MMNDVPVYTYPNGTLIGFGGQCVKSISVGSDNAVWAISCTPAATNDTTNFQIIKWDPFLNQWYKVPGRAGVQIAAFNEISAAVLTAQGKIYVSSDTGDSSVPVYLPRNSSASSAVATLFTDSVVASSAGSIWLRTQIPSNFTKSTLLWRCSRDGWSSANWHTAVDNKGSTVTIIKASTGRVFGGFAT